MPRCLGVGRRGPHGGYRPVRIRALQHDGRLAPFVANLVVEYQKDIKIYLGMLAIITAYQYMRRAGGKPGPASPGRLLVQTGRGDARFSR